MSPSLPGELTDRIISLVPDKRHGSHSDHQTLLSCALVCQDWLPASRAALLESICLDRKPAYDSFVKHVVHAANLSLYLHSTRTLWIHEPPGEDGSENREQPWTHRFIHDFAGRFPSLEDLHIWGVDWCASPPPHPTVHMAIGRFTSLRELDLHSCRLPSWHMLRRLVTALSPSLTLLTLWDVTCPVPREGTTALVHPAFCALIQFVFLCHWGDDDCFIPFLRWLSHTPTRQSLRSLDLSRSTNLTAEYTAFFTAIAPGLTELDLDVSLSSLNNFPYHELSSVRVLKLGLTWSHESYWKNLARILPQIPSRMRWIELRMFTKERKADMGTEQLPESLPIEHRDDGLELLDSVLRGDNFQELARLEFRLLHPPEATSSEAETTHARVLEVVQRKLPFVVSRGILAVRSI